MKYKIKKRNPSNSPMTGGQGAEVSKTLFYVKERFYGFEKNIDLR